MLHLCNIGRASPGSSGRGGKNKRIPLIQENNTRLPKKTRPCSATLLATLLTTYGLATPTTRKLTFLGSNLQGLSRTQGVIPLRVEKVRA